MMVSNLFVSLVHVCTHVYLFIYVFELQVQVAIRHCIHVHVCCLCITSSDPYFGLNGFEEIS